MPLSTARAEVLEASLAPTIRISEKGLVLGATVLAPMCDVGGAPEIAVDGVEERILALLAIVYGGSVRARVLDNIRRASRYWRKGQQTLAAIELALTGLPPLVDQEQASSRLSLGERLLAEGLSPRELINACGLDPALLDLVKGFNPDQPRVPAGNPNGGQWTGDNAADGGAGAGPSTPPRDPPSSAAGGQAGYGSSTPRRGQASGAAGTTLGNYTVIDKPPRDAKVVIPPDGAPIRGGDPPTLLIAPPQADYRQVYAAGQAIASLPFSEQYSRARAAIAQGGTYDFQRNVSELKLYHAYIPAANYAAGVYMAGAGYSLFDTLSLAKIYAFGHSSNYNTQDREHWIESGWNDANSGRWR
ncbi:MAG: hypothetical protein WA417_22400 [Stellaceae bacterium]